MISLLEKIVAWIAKGDGRWFPFVAIALPALTALLALLRFGHSMLGLLLTKIDEAASVLQDDFPAVDLSSIASDFWVTVNTFVPLDLIFELGLILITFQGVMAVVRIIKSFVPTVA